MNALSHPQGTTSAFQLSDKQLKSFASLGTADKAARAPDAVTVIPFVKEKFTRTEHTYVTNQSTPLRIYKNEYDKPPVCPWLMSTKCVVRLGDKSDPRAAIMEKAMKEVPRLMKEFEQDQERHKQAALSQSESSLEDTSSPADGPASSLKKDEPSTNKKDV